MLYSRGQEAEIGVFEGRESDVPGAVQAQQATLQFTSFAPTSSQASCKPQGEGTPKEGWVYIDQTKYP